MDAPTAKQFTLSCSESVTPKTGHLRKSGRRTLLSATTRVSMLSRGKTAAN